MKNQQANLFNVLSLFSGGGLLDIGFINNGFQINEAVEIEQPFIDAYNSGLSSYFSNSLNPFIVSKSINHNNISKPMDVSSREVQDYLQDKYKGISGVIGGPPCQDFSIGGKQAGISGERGKLIFSYVSIVEKIIPSFLFFENVAGLIKTKHHKISFDMFIKMLEDLGYNIWYDILNPLEYGLPQDRPRIALVGFKKTIVEKLRNAGYEEEYNGQKLKQSSNDDYIFRWPKIKFNNPKSLNWPRTWEFGSGIIRSEINNIPNEYNCLLVKNAFKGLSKSSPNHDEFFVPRSNKFGYIPEGQTQCKSFKRLHRYRYSPTVAYGNNEVHLHPTKKRRLTVREALRLQSVPDEYVLAKDIPLTHKFKVISNGVPTAKAELIAKEIKKTLFKYYEL